jgi:uncharacterized Zn-binding protein involved in type VI secretion
MGKPAARLTDMHVCPMVTPGLPPIPHVGGPITGPGCPTVLIGGLPAAVMGDMCTCVGPPDTIILGSVGVLIGGKPAARMGDSCVHGGTIVLGCPTVLIGEVSPVPNPPSPPDVSVPDAPTVAPPTPPVVAGGDIMVQNSGGLAAMPAAVIENVMKDAAPEVAVKLTQVLALKEAAEHGTALVHNPDTCEICAAKLRGSTT